MKKPTTILEIVKNLTLSEEEKLIIEYAGSSTLLLGARAFMLAELIAKYFNNGETENYWWGWYEPGSGFGASAYDCYFITWSLASSRLRFHTKEDFLYATKTFPEIYKILMEA